MRSSRPPYRFPAAAAFLMLVLLALHAIYYSGFISDDALISLRYAERFLDGRGLTWNDGERVEGYSNLLWVLASAGLGGVFRAVHGAAHIDLVNTLRALGLFGMGGALLAIIHAHRRTLAFSRPLSLAAPALFALSAPIAVWTVGGLEQPFVAAFLAWSIALLFPLLDRDELHPRDLLRAGLPLALLAVSRPDGMLFTVAAMLALLLARGFSRRTLASAAALAFLPALFYCAQLAFRLAYYGEWVPNTALVKVGFSVHRLIDGAKYVIRGVLPLLPALLPVALMLPRLLRDAERRSRVILLLTLAAFWLFYLIGIGGDIFPAGRHLVPVVVILAFLAGECVLHLMRGAGSTILGGVVAGLLLLYTVLQFVDARNRRALSERWEWDGRAIGLELRRMFPSSPPLLAVDAAGALPYWSRFPSVDMLGLNDYYLPRHPPADFGSGAVGHELGDGRYILSRRPDLIMFGPPPGNDTAGFRSGMEMQADPGFRRDYALSLIGVPGEAGDTITAHLWIRRESERIGVRHLGDSIGIPLYLLEGERAGDVVVENRGGRAAVRRWAWVRHLRVPVGLWEVRADMDPPTRMVAMMNGTRFQGHLGEPVGFPAGTGGRVDIGIEAVEGYGRIRNLSLRRIGDR